MDPGVPAPVVNTPLSLPSPHVHLYELVFNELLVNLTMALLTPFRSVKLYPVCALSPVLSDAVTNTPEKMACGSGFTVTVTVDDANGLVE